MVALTGDFSETISNTMKTPLSLFTFDHRVQGTLAQQTEKTADNNGTEDEITNIVEATMALKDPDMIDGALILDERKKMMPIQSVRPLRTSTADEYDHSAVGTGANHFHGCACAGCIAAECAFPMLEKGSTRQLW